MSHLEFIIIYCAWKGLSESHIDLGVRVPLRDASWLHHIILPARYQQCAWELTTTATWSLSWQGENEKCQQLARRLTVWYHTKSLPMIKTGIFWYVILSIWPAGEVLSNNNSTGRAVARNLEILIISKSLNYSIIYFLQPPQSPYLLPLFYQATWLTTL